MLSVHFEQYYDKNLLVYWNPDINFSCVHMEKADQAATHLYRKLTPMEQLNQQHGGDHDRLKTEYEELWTNPDIILSQLEEYFDDEFDAKGFLSSLFMVTN